MGLDDYRRKRDFSRTPEPSGKVRKRTTKGAALVVQKHAASRLHYDLRLEHDGVLLSWSVPKGPSLDPSEKRLAVQVEDHPVEYGGFEGIIPEGEYGGGTVMLWDRGTWAPIGDAARGLREGKLDLELHGERLRGRWTMVRLKQRPEDRGRASWLFFKRHDEHARQDGEEITETETTSVVSGRTMEEIASATGRERRVWRSKSAARDTRAGAAKARIRAAAKAGRASRSALRDDVGGIRVSSGDRVIDRASGATKLDLARYYEAIAPWLLAHGSGRPLALLRCPEGTAGQCFFQKHSHPGTGEHVHAEHDAFGEELLSVSDVRGVVALAQWGVVELHGWGSRLDALERPDWIVMDLDPAPDVAWRAVVSAAKELRARLRDIGLTSFVKTTGGKGLHVVVPLVRRRDWETTRSFAHAIALDLVERAPDRFTDNMSKRARGGKIFVDYLRNGRGATAVLPYSARAREGLPVALPIDWRDIDRVEPGELTVRTVPKLLAKRARDPWSELRATRQSISRAVLDALAR